MTRKHLIWIIGIAGGAFVLVALSYVFFFGGYLGLPLSDKPSTWGEFGDYMGGVLNPAFAFLAFVGVLLTIYLQVQQRSEAKNHAVIEEVQRLISAAAIELDSFLRQAPASLNLVLGGDTHQLTIGSSLAALGVAIASNAPTTDALKSKFLPAIQQTLLHVVEQISYIATALDRYEKIGGSSVVIHLYTVRYGGPAAALHLLGFLKEDKVIGRVFSVERTVAIWRED